MTTNPQTTAAIRPDWLSQDVYPFELRSIDLAGETVTYVDEGEGPPLLFVHTGMWSFIFRDVIVRLRDDFRCIALDFPGYGLSPDPAGDDLGLDTQSSLLGRFVDALRLSDVTLVLHDLGGLVGMGFAADQPDRVRAIVMANTFVWKPEGRALTTMLRIMASRPLAAFDRLTGLVPRLTATSSGVGRHLDKVERRAFLEPFQQRGRIGRFHSSMGDALVAEALWTRIESALAAGLAERPVLTIFGEKNDPFRFQERHHATFANHESLVIEGGNHFPMMDDPDRFAAKLREWWNRAV